MFPYYPVLLFHQYFNKTMFYLYIARHTERNTLVKHFSKQSNIFQAFIDLCSTFDSKTQKNCMKKLQ